MVGHGARLEKRALLILHDAADVGVEFIPDEVTALVAKRTVYNQSQLAELVGKGALVILFRLIKYIPGISAVDLKKVGIKGAIQTIRTISQDDFNQLVTDAAK